MEVYIDGVLQRYVEYYVKDGVLVFNRAPHKGAQINIATAASKSSGWHFLPLGDGTTIHFKLSPKILEEVDLHESMEVWECRKILQQINEELTDPRLQEEIKKLGTFATLLREHNGSN
jgi:hypothetical protein